MQFQSLSYAAKNDSMNELICLLFAVLKVVKVIIWSYITQGSLNPQTAIAQR